MGWRYSGAAILIPTYSPDWQFKLFKASAHLWVIYYLTFAQASMIYALGTCAVAAINLAVLHH